MKRLIDGWSWIRALLLRRTVERDLDEEIRFHLDEQTEKNRRAGMSPNEARRQAMVRFGGVESVRERTRDEIRPAFLDELSRNVQYALRGLGRAPGFATAALLTLGVGIGGTSAIFSVVRTVMLEPLPYAQPDRVVTVWETSRGGGARNVIAPSNFVAWRERSRTLEHVGMVGPETLDMVVNGQPDQVAGLSLSADAFAALGVEPAIGRAYSAAEDFGGARRVIVVSHEFWHRRLGGRQDVLGLTLSASDGPLTIIGVMPSAFTVVGQKAEFLVPFGRTLEQLRAVRGRGNAYAVARLRDGVTFDQAVTEMRAIFADLEKENPRLNAARTIELLPLQEQLVGDVRPALFALAGAMVLVLIIACVNVANLLLARSAARQRELGMRTALGAARGRLVRQMLTESLVLAAGGGIAGLAVAALCHRGLLALAGDRIQVPRLDQVTLDLPVVAFTTVVALASGILFGLAPAFVSTSTANEALREDGRARGGRRLHGALGALVVMEVALSLVLLAGAGLLTRSFLKLQSVDTGFRVDGVITAATRLPRVRYENAQADRTLTEAIARIRALPGVEHAAGASCMVVPFPCIGTSFWRTDRPKPADGQVASAQVRPVTPGFFDALEIPLVSGRDFAASDTADAAPVAVVSQELVTQQFGDADPLGQRLRIEVNHASGRTDVEWTIVGVVGNIRSTLDGPVRQTIFVPHAQRPGTSMSLFVRSAQDPAGLGPSIAAAVHALEPEAPVRVQPLDEVIGGTIARPRALSILVGLFACIALALAAVGVYGVMAYSVRERTQEIGVRMALGATASAVFRLVLGRALRLVAAGIAIGLVAAGGLTQLLQRLLYDTEPFDPLTFAITALVLLAVAALASCGPARRSMRMAPVDALRTN